MRAFRTLTIVCALAAGVFVSRVAWAEQATAEEARRVCQNWLTYMVHERGAWAGAARPQIVAADDLVEDGVLLARCYSIAPQGHVVVPILKELPPVKAYSDTCGLDAYETRGFAQLLREVLHHRVMLFTKVYGSTAAVARSSKDRLLDPVHRDEWDRLLVDPDEFLNELGRGAIATIDEGRPLMTTNWHQKVPYHNDCPTGYNSSTCLVGCVATAAAQVMNYHQWPQTGSGSHTYYWNGDDSCRNSQGNVVYGGSAGNRTGTFSDAYDWPNMLDDYYHGHNQAQRSAVSELCYEVGVAFDMDYGSCGSYATTSDATTVLPTYFRYSDEITRVYRSSYTAQTWFNLIKEEIKDGRPMLYRMYYKDGTQQGGHAIVCDGWRQAGTANQYHINYGWDKGSHTGWYTIDKIYNTFEPTTREYLVYKIKPATTITVCPNGSGDYLTIKAGIYAAADGDVIDLCDATYTGADNRMLQYGSKRIIVRSESADPEACIIDGQSSGPIFDFFGPDLHGMVIQRITIKNGSAQRGGGIKCLNSSPRIQNCLITENSASVSGGGIFCYNSSPEILSCIFSENTAVECGGGLGCWNECAPKVVNCRFLNNQATTQFGGGMWCYNSPAPDDPTVPKLIDCLFSGNTAMSGGGMYAHQMYPPEITGCTFVNNTAAWNGGGLCCQYSSPPTIKNCTFYANSGAFGGGGVYLNVNSPAVLSHTIIASSTAGEAIFCANNSTPTLECCDLWGNAAGNWRGYPFAADLGTKGNIELDPIFCGPPGDLTIRDDSPCAAECSGSGCGLIGAWPVGCQAPGGDGITFNGSFDGYGTGLYSSQSDYGFPFNAQAADDFSVCSCNSTVTGVAWTGGYLEGPPSPGQPFNIYFYQDNGTGAAPTGGPGDPSGTAVAAYEEVYPTEVENLDDTLHYEAVLPVAFEADPATKYWIAIQWRGESPTRWGISNAVNSSGFPAVTGFPLQGTDYWTETDPRTSLAFQLIGPTEPPAAGACCLEDGSCSVLEDIECYALGGTLGEPGSTCAGAVHACCLPDGECAMMDAECCENIFDGTSLTGEICTHGVDALRACCFADDTCLDLDPLCCASHPVHGAGTPQEEGSTCGGDCNSNAVPDGCETIEDHDFDGDGDVDLDDLRVFVDCMGGPATLPEPTSYECVTACRSAFDSDEDGDIDLLDFAAFQEAFTGEGPAYPPFDPTDDVWIDSWSPGTNYNYLQETRVRNGYQTDYESDTLIRFDISSIPPGTGITSATLHLYYFGYLDNNPAGRALTCHRLLGGWDEATVTFGTQPAHAAGVTDSSTVPPASGAWMTWDLTTDVQDFIDGVETDYGWIIMDEVAWPGGNIPWPRFRTKEYGDFIPYLVIE